MSAVSKLKETICKVGFLEGLWDRASAIKKNLIIWRWRNVDDPTYSRIRFKRVTGKELDLENPRTIDEKLHWLKLYYRNPLLTKLADKIQVKDYIAQKVGKEHAVPIIKVWNDVDDINFEELPDEYILKCNHNSTSYFIKRKNHILTEGDIKRLKNRFRRSLRSNYYYYSREWVYKDISPKVFAEDLVFTEKSIRPTDFKFFCYNGEPRFLHADSNHETGTTVDFYDLEWNSIPVRLTDYPNSKTGVARSDQLMQMIDICKKLAEGLPFVRVDFFVDEKTKEIYVSEMTFVPVAALLNFIPECYNELFGSYLELPERWQDFD